MLLSDSPVADNVTSSDISSRLVEMWLHGRSPHTQDSYRRHIRSFLRYVNKPLDLVTLADIQGWQLTLNGMAPNSQRTAMAAVKSLLAFAYRLRILPVNVGLPVTHPKAKDTLNERILSEEEVQAMIALEIEPRNRAILRLLYSAGLRVSELCALIWKDLTPRGTAGQVTVFGKGGRTRTVLLPTPIWHEICQIRGDAKSDDPVFRSRESDDKVQSLHRSQVHRSSSLYLPY